MYDVTTIQLWQWVPAPQTPSEILHANIYSQILWDIFALTLLEPRRKGNVKKHTEKRHHLDIMLTNCMMWGLSFANICLAYLSEPLDVDRYEKQHPNWIWSGRQPISSRETAPICIYLYIFKEYNSSCLLMMTNHLKPSDLQMCLNWTLHLQTNTLKYG